MTTTWTYIYKDKNGFWIEGIKKRKLSGWMELVPLKYEGFVEIEKDQVILYNKDWSIRKKIKRYP